MCDIVLRLVHALATISVVDGRFTDAGFAVAMAVCVVAVAMAVCVVAVAMAGCVVAVVDVATTVAVELVVGVVAATTAVASLILAAS